MATARERLPGILLLPPLLPPLAWTSAALTVVSMAALGLGVDVRTVAKAGPAVTSTAAASLALLLLVSLALMKALHV